MPNKIAMNANYPNIEISTSMLNRAEELIPSYSQTLAKSPQQNIRGIAPVYIKSGKGSHVIDVDGNEYIDLTMGVGPLSIGYSIDEIDNAIIEQLHDGITFSLMHPLELEVAEMIRDIVPNAEMVRYSKSGNDVTSAAVRLARAYTGKDTILCCGYHGWHDWYIAVTDRNKGIPESTKNLTYTFNYNDLEQLIDSIDEDTAAIILEPVVFEEPKNNFLHEIRRICDEKGIVLIFDEMWTGFRIALGGAQEYFGVKADLATFSKAVANGMPLSIITGKKEIMQLLHNDVFFYNTFGGEALSLAAAKATINFMKKHKVIEYLDKQGAKLKDGYNLIAAELDAKFTKAIGYNFRSLITFSAEYGNPAVMKTYMQQEMIKRGVLWGGFHNMSYSHSDSDIEHILNSYKEVIPIMKNALENNNLEQLLKGEPLEPVFRRVGNFNTKPKENKR